MDRLVDHLFVLEGMGNIRDFPGNYSQYRESVRLQERPEVEDQKPEPPKQAAPAAARKKLSYKEQREFDTLEKEIQVLENEKKAIHERMASPDLPFDELQKMSDRLGVIASQIDEKEMRWLELSEATSSS